MFCSYHGAGYGCNPKYITQALLQRAKLPLDIIWLTRQHDESIPASVRQLRYGSVDAAQALSTAQVWVDNTRTRRYLKKKPEQFYIQTWHGCLSPKLLEADMEAFLSKTYIRGAQQDSRDADLMICNNDHFEGVMRRAFWYDGTILRCGLPRNAPLIHPRQEVREQVRKRLGVPAGFGLCLYAPTFRDDGDTSVYCFDYQRCCQSLEQRFGMPFVFALRLHPNLAHDKGLVTSDNIINVSSYSDPIELLCAADVCISDYSSMAEDFALLGRPGYLYLPDMDAFSASRGGIYYPHDVRPYPAATSEDELMQLIATTPDAEFAVRREAFFDMVGLDDDGYGDYVLAEIIESYVAGKSLSF